MVGQVMKERQAGLEVMPDVSKEAQMEIKSALRIDRREFLGGSAIVAGSLLLAGAVQVRRNSVVASQAFTAEQSVSHYLAEMERNTFGILERVPDAKIRPLTSDYLNNVIAYLKAPKGDAESRVKAIMDNVCMTGNGSNCTMLDEAGIFLAAGHSYGSLPGGELKPMERFFITWVLDPRIQRAYVVRQTIIYPEIDTAIVYAPTGKSFRALPIQIDFNDLKGGEELWTYAIYKTESQGRRIYAFESLHGRASASITPHDAAAYANMFGVEGVVPFGGSSGSPIVDRQGVLRGTVSGGLESPEDRQRFTGTRGAYVKGLAILLEGFPKSLHTIPMKVEP